LKGRHRLLATLIVAALAGAVLVAVGATWLLRTAVRDRYVERLRAETAMLGDWVEDYDGNLQELAALTGRRLGFRVTLIDGSGAVVGDSAKDQGELAGMDNHLNRPEVRGARLRGSGESLRTSATTRVEYFYSARRLERPGRVEFVRIALPAHEISRVQTRYSWLVVGVFLVSMTFLTLLTYGAVRRLSRPMEAMTDSVERAAAGELNLELPQAGGEEIARLAAAVRRMQHALLEKIAELDTERSVLSSVVSDMREGLILVGPDHRIRVANQSLRQILNLTFNPVDHLLAEVVRHPTLLFDVEAALSEGRETRESVLRMESSGRSFELHVTSLKGPGDPHTQGALVLLFDITRLEALEGVRREFVANVSHELRTPLTSIKASVETLIDGDIDDRDNANRFLEIIGRNANYMSALIEDLTDLSLIETGAVVLDLRTLDATEVVREVVERFRPLAETRKVELIVDLQDPLRLRADRRRLEQMMTNLVDNALKFGGHIRVRGDRDHEGGIVLAVEDTGVGIPAGSREMIFHRFYQEDRQRSRQAGGTGLGLALVKHLMRLHGGAVRVKSELGRGAVFSLDFPPAPTA
jgi:two-component system phosphate regulon sensor histidine kinase PhoR